MIINISGTSGSGKSTIVRAVMALYDRAEPLMAERKRPLAYTCYRKEGRKLFIPGHYETDCGGCDTLSNFFEGSMYDGIITWIRAAHNKDADVLYEGLIMESEVNRLIQLHKDGFPVVCVGIDISLDDCLASIKKRRESKGKFAELNPKNTIAKFKQARRKRERLTEAGIKVQFVNREKSFEFIKNLLGFSGEENVPLKFEDRPITRFKTEPVFDLQGYLEGKVSP